MLQLIISVKLETSEDRKFPFLSRVERKDLNVQ